MDSQEEILKERRKNEQIKSLEDLNNSFKYHFIDHDFSMHIEITLDDYKPEYHLDYDRNRLPESIKEYSKALSTHINGFFCELFRELEIFSDGWYYHCEDSYGASIYIKEDGIIIFHWHYNYSDSIEQWGLQSILMSAYFTMFLCFLSFFYKEINYTGKIHSNLNINGIENCVFYPPRSSSSRKVFPYNKTPYEPITRIIFLDRLSQKEEVIRIVFEIFTRILSYYFNYYNYQIPIECIKIIDSS